MDYEQLKKQGCVFKIQRSDANLFSTGGRKPRWSKTGKLFTSVDNLRAHLRAVDAEVYKDCFVITYHLLYARYDSAARELEVLSAIRKTKPTPEQRQEAEERATLRRLLSKYRSI